jgi:hypothetical protein
MESPTRAVRGITVFISRKMARSGIDNRTEPKPDRPWVKPARKVMRQTHR